MEIKKAVFELSAPRVDLLPPHTQHEFAFIGRSNVGKSSLINCLCGCKIAHTSSTPGKTQLINRFIVNNSWRLVDLPGYGFARVGAAQRAALERMIYDYIQKAPQLTLLFVLIDCRHPLQKIDATFLNYLGQWGIPFSLIFTKADKPSPTALKRHMASYQEELSAYWESLPPVWATSSETGLGRQDLLNYIGSLI